MSHVTETAEREAAEAEAEQPDDPETAEEEEAPPESPESPPDESTGPTEEQMAALDREDKRHEKNLAGIMGADFGYFARCGQCDGLGFYMPPPPVEVRFQQHPHTFKCPTCEGMGDVASGAVGRNQLVECPDCGGQGYKQHAQTAAPAAPAPVVPSGDDAAVQRLREQGFTVVPPYVPPPETVGRASIVMP